MSEQIDRVSHYEKHSAPNWESLNSNTYRIDAQLDRCMDQDPHPAADRDCLNSAQKSWDRQLNDVYQAFKSELNPTTGNLLQSSERQWVKFKESEEKTINQLLNTNDSNVLIARANMQLTQDRANELLGTRIDFPYLGERANDCITNAGSVGEKNSCINKALETAEADLNITYQALRSQLNPKNQEVLKNSQLAWLDFRKKENSFIDNYHPSKNGQISQEASYAKLNVTQHRTKQLQFFLRNYQQ